MDPVEIIRRDGPLVLSLPHSGTHVPRDIGARLTETGRGLPDTDWWLERLYDFDDELDATVVRASASRYVIDVNRPPDDTSLYPGQFTTGLCPTVTFDGEPLYADGDAPDPTEIESRRRKWHEPYHAALAAELERVRERHGVALLYDCHSIRSRVPRLFDGELPVLNIGTNDGQSCAPGLEAAITEICSSQDGFSHVINGRFRGGWITRHYGRPDAGIHAVQMELAQRAYMLERPPREFDAVLAERIRPVLRNVLDAMLAWARQNRTGD